MAPMKTSGSESKTIKNKKPAKRQMLEVNNVENTQVTVKKIE